MQIIDISITKKSSGQVSSTVLNQTDGFGVIVIVHNGVGQLGQFNVFGHFTAKFS